MWSGQGNIATVICLCNIVSNIFGQYWLDYGLGKHCAGIVLHNVGSSRPRQQCVDYFPAKACLVCYQGANIAQVTVFVMLSQTTMNIQYSYAMNVVPPT